MTAKTIKREEIRAYEIDATDRKPGRLAGEVAELLLGKDKADFAKNIVAPVRVEIKNASKMDIDPKKMEGKKYKSFSGYPSGLKEKTMAKVIDSKGYAIVLKKAVYGMLPGNKLRAKRMKNLHISE